MEPIESPLSRIQAALAKLERPVICTNCGGSWFQIVEFHRLAQTGYASLEFDPTEAMSQTVRICLCGKIFKAVPQMRAGRTPNAEMRSFAESMDLATERPHTPTPGQIAKLQKELDAVIEQVATKQEFHLLNLEIAALRDEVDQLKRGQGVDVGRQTEAAPRPEEGPTEGKPSPGRGPVES